MNCAEETTSTTDLKFDKLISDGIGLFYNNEPCSTQVAGFGIINISSDRKNMKVTATAEFILKQLPLMRHLNPVK